MIIVFIEFLFFVTPSYSVETFKDLSTQNKDKIPKITFGNFQLFPQVSYVIARDELKYKSTKVIVECEYCSRYSRIIIQGLKE